MTVLEGSPDPLANVPPQSIDAEVMVLGSMLFDSGCIAAVRSLIGPADYFRPQHGLIHEAICSLADRQEPTELVAVVHELEVTGKLAKVGGREYVGEIFDGTPSAANAEYYARIVRDAAVRRGAIVQAEALRRRAHDAANIVEGLTEAQADLAALAAGADGAGRANGPVLMNMADVKPQEVRWLWPGRVPLAKLSMLVGDPDLGKSLITLDVVARVTRGWGFPDCPDFAAEPASAIVLSAEDDPADTIAPRLIAAGADLRRVVQLQAVRAGGRERPFNLDDDLRVLEAALDKTPGCRVIVLDPITAYMGGRIDAHKNSEVRAILAPLAELAGRRGVAVLAVAHLNKGQSSALYRVAGSLALVAAARSVLIFAKDADDPSGRRRLMLRLKGNLAPDPGGLAYRLDSSSSSNGQPVVLWEPGGVTTTADEALSAERGRPGPEPTERREAEAWLQDALAGGPRPAAELLAEGRTDGFSPGTLRRAKGALGITAAKPDWQSGWKWTLPEGAHEGAQVPQTQITCAPSGKPAHLREKQGVFDGSSDPEFPEGAEDAQVVGLAHLRAAEGDEDADGGNGAGRRLEPDRLIGTADGTAGSLEDMAVVSARPEKGDEAAEDRRAAGAVPIGPLVAAELSRLDPDRPGPLDQLNPKQREAYLADYHSPPADAHPTEKHERAWRAAVGERSRETAGDAAEGG